MLTEERSSVTAGDVALVEASLRELVERLDPDAVFVFDAPECGAAFDRVVRFGESAKTLLARRFEDAQTWRADGFRSTAEQLASVSGTSVTAARAMLETSKQVAELPATAQAMRSGALSEAQARVIAAAAKVAPDAEARLLALAARAPLAELSQECLRARAGDDRDAAHERIRRERYLREWTDAEGAWNLKARGTPEAGARVRAALEPLIDEIFKTARKNDAREPHGAYAFDALIQLAAGDASDGKPKQARSSFAALIRADLEALQRGAVEGDEICEIVGLGPIPVRVARELLGDAVVKLVITKGVDVMNVTHLGRSATVAQQVALWWRSPMCTAEGCTRSRHLQNDHNIGWVETKRTRLDELDPLCTHHHDLKTYFGWALIAGRGTRAMVPPDDRRHPKRQ